MKKISLEQELASVLRSENPDNFLKQQLYDYKSIFLNRVFPDASNPRFFPAVIISDVHAYQLVSRQLSKQQLISIYHANDKVIIGKSCIVNCCIHNSIEWKKANKSIESIIELAENVAVSELIQVPTIYPTDNGDFQILTGHRRFFAMIYANGVDSASHFKVYQSKPALQKTKQFQENSCREDLPQYGKLQAYQDSIREIEVLNTSLKRMGKKALTVRKTASILGISMGAYDNYNVLSRYPAIFNAYKNGNSTSFVKMKKFVLKIEEDYKLENNVLILNVDNKKEVNKKIKSSLNDVDKNQADSIKKQYSCNISQINSPELLKMILQKNIFELELGLDWDAVNWDDSIQVNRMLKELIKKLLASNDIDRR